MREFHHAIDEIAFRFWKCQRCYSMKHTTESCTNKIKCHKCYGPGHIAKDYLGSPPLPGPGTLRWKAKSAPRQLESQPTSSRVILLDSLASPEAPLQEASSCPIASSPPSLPSHVLHLAAQ